MKHVAFALHDYLAKHNIPDRDKVRLVVVVPDQHAKHYLLATIKADEELIYGLGLGLGLAHDEVMIDGVRIMVRVPKQAVTL